MSEKKLPEYVEPLPKYLEDAVLSYRRAGETFDASPPAELCGRPYVLDALKLLRVAIRRYASEREAAALEKAAKAVSALCFGEIERLNGISADRPHEFKFGPGVQSPRLLAMNDALAAIRALIPKESSK